MLKSEAAAIYAAYSELENAAEAFYAAATKLVKVCPESADRINNICEEINCVIISVDDELDEVL
jgi:hypothetical protein